MSARQRGTEVMGARRVAESGIQAAPSPDADAISAKFRVRRSKRREGAPVTPDSNIVGGVCEEFYHSEDDGEIGGSHIVSWKSFLPRRRRRSGAHIAAKVGTEHSILGFALVKRLMRINRAFAGSMAASEQAEKRRRVREQLDNEDDLVQACVRRLMDESSSPSLFSTEARRSSYG